MWPNVLPVILSLAEVRQSALPDLSRQVRDEITICGIRFFCLSARCKRIGPPSTLCDQRRRTNSP